MISTLPFWNTPTLELVVPKSIPTAGILLAAILCSVSIKLSKLKSSVLASAGRNRSRVVSASRVEGKILSQICSPHFGSSMLNGFRRIDYWLASILSRFIYCCCFISGNFYHSLESSSSRIFAIARIKHPW